MEEVKSDINIKPEFLTLLANLKCDKSIDEKINLSLAIFLFTERAVTLARAAELAGIGIGDFTSALIDHNVVWSEYTEGHKEQDYIAMQYILEEESKND